MPLKIAGRSRRLAADTQGGVAIIVALSLPVILGFSALAVEYSSALITRTENQRTSDIAAFAAAYAYNRDATASATEKEKAATIAARSIADLNGVSSEAVVVKFDDPAAAKIIDVTISEDKPIYLSRLLRADDSVTINTDARVALGQAGGFDACILVLDPDVSEGVRGNGNSGTYNLTGCGIGANAPIAFKGKSIDTNCAAPHFNNSGGGAGCAEEKLQSGFTDPFESLTNWPNDPSDNSVCDHVGAFPEAFLASSGSGGQTGGILKTGVLCVTTVNNFGEVMSDPNGTGNTLIV